MKGGLRQRQRGGRRGPSGRRRGTDRRAARARPGPASPRPLSPPPRPHGKRPVPVRPAGMRCGARVARPSRRAASTAREPGSRFGLRLPATSARSFFQGHGELAEGVEERAEAAGQAQHHDAQVAPHRAGPAPPTPPPPPRPPGRTGTEGAAPRSRGRNKFLLQGGLAPACPPTTAASSPTAGPQAWTPPPPPRAPPRRAGSSRTRRRTERESAGCARGAFPACGVRDPRAPAGTPTREQVIPEPGALNCRGGVWRNERGRWKQLTQIQMRFFGVVVCDFGQPKFSDHVSSTLKWREYPYRRVVVKMKLLNAQKRLSLKST